MTSHKKVGLPFSEPIKKEFRDAMGSTKLDVIIRGRMERIVGDKQGFEIGLADGVSAKDAQNVPILFKAEFGRANPCEKASKLVTLQYKKQGNCGWEDLALPSELHISEGRDFTIVISIKPRTIGVKVDDRYMADVKRMVELDTINRLVITGDHLTLYEPEYRTSSSRTGSKKQVNLEQLKNDAIKLRDTLTRIIKDLESFLFKTLAAKITGLCFGLFGTGITVASAVAAPFVFGSTLPLAMVGTAITTAAIGTSAVGTIVELVGKYGDLEQLDEDWGDFGAQLKKVVKFKTDKAAIDKATRELLNKAVKQIKAETQELIKEAVEALIGEVEDAGAEMLLEIGLNVTCFALTITEIIKYASEIHSKDKNKVVEVMKNIKAQLDTLIAHIEELLDDTCSAK